MERRIRWRPTSTANWSVCCLDAGSGSAGSGSAGSGPVLADIDGDRVLSTASVGKILILLEAARQLADGRATPDVRLARDGVAPVADSGLWQHLDVPDLSIGDAARLVGAVSDNLAANVLIHHLGLEVIQRGARQLGVGTVALHDYVRTERTPDVPPMLSSGSARDWARLMVRLGSGELTSHDADAQVLAWLALSHDLTMVPASFLLDPLSHAHGSSAVWDLPTASELSTVSVINKTGTDEGVRADVGLVRGRAGFVAYACLADFEPSGSALEAVMSDMRALGVAIGTWVR